MVREAPLLDEVRSRKNSSNASPPRTTWGVCKCLARSRAASIPQPATSTSWSPPTTTHPSSTSPSSNPTSRHCSIERSTWSPGARSTPNYSRQPSTCEALRPRRTLGGRPRVDARCSGTTRRSRTRRLRPRPRTPAGLRGSLQPRRRSRETLVAADPDRFVEPIWSQAAQICDFVVHHYDRLDADALWNTVAESFPELRGALAAARV